MAENESVFRDANEQIESRARELEFPRPVPFLCECGDAGCHAIVPLSFEEYEAVRSEPSRFFVAPGHEAAEGASGRVIERHEAYVVLEKVGAARDVAEQRNPRQPAG